MRVKKQYKSKKWDLVLTFDLGIIQLMRVLLERGLLCLLRQVFLGFIPLNCARYSSWNIGIFIFNVIV